MKSERPSTDAQLATGLYDQVVSERLHQMISELQHTHRASQAELQPEDAHAALAQYLELVMNRALSAMRGRDSLEKQRSLANRIVETIHAAIGEAVPADSLLADPLRRLLAIQSAVSSTGGERPDTPLAFSALLTGTRIDPALAAQLRKEIASADRVDILCSFIKWSGLRLLLEELRQFTAMEATAGRPRLRVITTSYMGATDPRAAETLCELPNTEVRVSYDTRRTRLHAKAYIIHRDTGFGSAYVGSANLSHAALSEGLEWTSKISQYELPHLWGKVTATFETYWNDDEFEAYDAQRRERLRIAISEQRGDFAPGAPGMPTFDLRPFPFQQEVLDALVAEREIQQKSRHLIVAATGTGKTMVSAFDYRNWGRNRQRRPTLLFVAHREEILRQALHTFRAVLRDQNFGELLVGGCESESSEHLFCSIQSYNSRGMCRLDAARYDYVVVDEFHHAAAPSYRRLLDHVQPQVLLGLTATPERTDQLDVFQWFGGEASAEIRLPDAISRRLLCPFQYFGISDSVDLDDVTWQRGGYRVEELEKKYNGNHVRGQLVVDKVRELLLDPRRARGLGFCVSVAHAEFMAAFFREAGIPAEALSARSADDLRRGVQEKLRRREINFIFVVDLYNEGVDIPEIDAVLFLRPTESLTVYLQQLGRGLRLHDEKECLTVLDFIGNQRREFRFAPRFRAMGTEPGRSLQREVEDGFPHLPPGCFVRLEKQAQQRVLDNIRAKISRQRSRLVAELRELRANLKRRPTLLEGLDCLDISLDELLKRGLWTRMLADAERDDDYHVPDEKRLARGLRRLAHIDDPTHLRFLLGQLERPAHAAELQEVEKRRLAMLYITLWSGESAGWSLGEAQQRLVDNGRFLEDLRAVLTYRLAHTHTRPAAWHEELSGPLAVHALYTRDEILAGLGHWTMDSRRDFREGVLHLPENKVDAFFVTLEKTEDAYSPTTMYEDYVISDRLFHWQSQCTTSAESPTGNRYLHHRELGYTPLLFVREQKRLPSGLSAPYAYLGPAEYVSHEGSRPISIVWRLRHAIPARLLRPIGRQTAG